MTAKPSAQRGTPEWFKREKLSLIETAKAVDSFSAAVSSFQKLVEFGVTADADVRSALHTAGVINYARPFTNNSPGKEGHRTSFAKKIFKGHQSYDDEIHLQLMLLRNKLIAHSDGDYADSRLFRKSLNLHIGSEQFKIFLGATVLTLTVQMLEDMDLAKRYLAHVRAAQEAAHASLAKRLEEFVKAGQQFPDALEAAADAKLGPPIDAGQFQLSPDKPDVKVPLTFLNPYTVLNLPKLTLGQDGYAYRSFVMQTDLSIDVNWRNDDGSEAAFKWEAMVGESGPDSEET
jgi:hypothetical protein